MASKRDSPLATGQYRRVVSVMGFLRVGRAIGHIVQGMPPAIDIGLRA